MLLGIPPEMPADLLDCLMRMGHGDELVIADANFPATSVSAGTYLGAPIHMPGFDAPSIARMVCALMPLDAYSEACAYRMEIDDAPDEIGPVHREVFDILAAAMPEGATLSSIERQAFYPRAKQAFGVVSCTESRPFGCFILRKGVIF